MKLLNINPPESRSRVHKGITLLRRYLIWIIIFASLLPSLLAVGAVTLAAYGTRRRDLEEMTLNSASFAFDTAVYKISSLLSESARAERLPQVGRAYEAYQLNGDGNALYNDMTAFLTRQYGTKEGIDNAYFFFFFSPGTVYFCQADESCYEQYEHYVTAVHASIAAMVTEAYHRPVFTEIDGKIYLYRQIYSVDNDGEEILSIPPHAGIVLEVSPSVFSMSSVPMQTGEAFLLGDIIRGSSIEAAGLLPKNFGDEKAVNLDRDRALVTASAYLPAEGGVVPVAYAGTLNADALSGRSFVLLIPVAVMFVIVPVACGLIIYFFKINLDSPLKRLLSAYNRLEIGYYGVQADHDEKDSAELERLIKSFNAMSVRLKENIDRKARDEEALMEARMKALQSQINPHFLNNTLEIINWEAQFAGSEKVTKMIGALSTILEASIDRTGSPMVPLSEEMKYIDSYLYIISQRLGSRLETSAVIDPAVMDIPVPRLCLQPIIENAVEHGGLSSDKIEITIRAFREKGVIRIIVLNSGSLSGNDSLRIKKILGEIPMAGLEQTTNVGIRNTSERLRLSYGEGGNLSIYSTPEGNTACEISIDEQSLEALQ
ncbi:MAG: sensor histidine kinase [Oscillospiraceae bacterium]|nr:sensor histidine kinase [Oscillospiraceae bacterium]